MYLKKEISIIFFYAAAQLRIFFLLLCNYYYDKKQYYKMALKFHPDKNKAEDAAEIFKLVGEAYEVSIYNRFYNKHLLIIFKLILNLI